MHNTIFMSIKLLDKKRSVETNNIKFLKNKEYIHILIYSYAHIKMNMTKQYKLISVDNNA
jgi:hypothetical protein